MTYENIYIDGANDKGISVGEKSNVNGFSLDILNSSIGIASKDLSIFKGKDISIKNTNLGFAVFQKKPEFGPAAITIETIDKSLINNLKFDNVLENIQATETYLLEDQSSLSVNGYLFSPNSTNTKKSLYD